MSAAADRKLAGGGPEAIAARLRRQLAPDDVLAAVIAELVGHPAGPELASDQPMVGERSTNGWRAINQWLASNVVMTQNHHETTQMVTAAPAASALAAAETVLLVPSRGNSVSGRMRRIRRPSKGKCPGCSGRDGRCPFDFG